MTPGFGKNHSGLGIASFCIFVGGGLFAMAMVTIGMVKLSGTRMGGSGEDIILGGAVLGFILDIVALGLGVAGLCQRGRKKVFAILGTALSTLILLAALALVVLGIGPALGWWPGVGW
jgi:hypothetical protein